MTEQHSGRDDLSRAIDATLMGYSAVEAGREDAFPTTITSIYGECLDAAPTEYDLGIEVAGIVSGHLTLTMLLLQKLVELTGRMPDDLLREMLGD